ncbi:hypothetical protein [Streptomyces angustmyceticus]|uniref:hypothetical protein n=1 Tax=Streptomyces angustmyceticus TaxID=285578 RepID=UPI00344B5F0D
MPQHTRKRTLAAATGAGWTHPYGSSPFSPVLYADGGEGDEGEAAPKGEAKPDKPEVEPQDDPAGDDEGDDPKLGEAGEKALKAERAARKAADKKAAELEAEVSRLRRSNAANKGTDVDAIKAEIRADIEGASAARIIRAEVKAAAAKRLADPGDAVKLLDLSAFELNADGDVDTKAVTKALDDLLKEKPYLAAGKQPWGDVGGGHRDPAAADVEPGMARLRHAYATETKRK